jgi:hypothetical protein
LVYDLTEIDTTGRLINHFNKDAPPLRYTTFDNISLRSFFYAHNSRSQSLIEKRLQQIGDAHEVTDDLALIEPMILTTKCLVAQLRQFHQAMSEFDRKIKELPQFFRRDLRRRRHKRIEMEKDQSFNPEAATKRTQRAPAPLSKALDAAIDR